MAVFLSWRAMVWEENRQLRKCVEAFAWASGLVPEHGYYSNTLRARLNDWHSQLQARQPAGFPSIFMKELEPIFPPTLPANIRNGLLGMIATENLFNDAQNEARWWSRMWQDQQG